MNDRWEAPASQGAAGFGASEVPPLDMEFLPDQSKETGLLEHLPSLPTPAPLHPEQFMPVLPPEMLAAYLRESEHDLQLLEDEAARSELRRRARVLALKVEQYAINYAATHAALSRTLAETGAGVRDSWVRQEEHLRQRHQITSGSERAYLEATDALQQAEQQRFEALSRLGVRPDTRTSADLYTQLAVQELAAEGKPYRPAHKRSLSAQFFGFFATFSKFFVGLLSGVSINMLFNPDSRLYLTIIALMAGVMLSVLLLWLVEELSYRARISVSRSKYGSIAFIVLVAAIYLGVEGFLNWDGILRVTQQLAADAASSGMLTDLSSAPDTPETPPQHWSLLAFTLALVSMAVGAAVIQGRNRAGLQLENERLESQIARLKQRPDFQEAARATEMPALLEEARGRIQPPRNLSNPKHARLNEQVLSWWEKERDERVNELSNAIAREAQEVQALLEKLAQDIQEARFPKVRRKVAGIF